MATNTQRTASSARRRRSTILQAHGAHLAFGVGEVLGDGRVPDRLDLRMCQHAGGHDFRRAQGVAAVDEVHLGSETGQEKRFFRRRIAAADDADRHVAVKRAVAGGATRSGRGR